MNIPEVITALIAAQNHSNSQAYSECFAETAVVFDEGKTYKGKAAIKSWIEKANQQYKTQMKPLEYAETEQILKAEISGTFPGSPLVLSYNFDIRNGSIHALKISA